MILFASGCSDKKPQARDNPCSAPSACKPAELLPIGIASTTGTDVGKPAVPEGGSAVAVVPEPNVPENLLPAGTLPGGEAGAGSGEISSSAVAADQRPAFTFEYMPAGSNDGLKGTIWNYFEVPSKLGGTAYFAEWISPLRDLDGSRSVSAVPPHTSPEPVNGRVFLIQPDALVYGDGAMKDGTLSEFGVRFYLKYPAAQGEVYDEVQLAHEAGLLSADELENLPEEGIPVTVGEETLETPNGSYRAITYSFQLPSDVESYKLYFVKGIGLVRMDWVGRKNVVQMLQPAGAVKALRARVPVRMQEEYRQAVDRWKERQGGRP